MSFGGGGFGGFGQNNNSTASSGFGGFGQNNNTTAPASGFGAANNNAFGANQPAAGGSLFGSNNNNNAGGGFGTASAFGSGNAFGAKPTGFGATATTSSGGGLFGSTTATAGNTGFGGGSGFGSAATSSPFGGGGGTSLFGGNKPGGFGSTAAPAAGGGMFGSNNTGGGFGATNSAFGATTNPGIGTNVGDPPGTAGAAFTPTVEKDQASNQSSSYQNILFMDPYKKWSLEELRLTDYNQGRRFGNSGGTGAFGGNTFGTGTFGGTGQTSAFGTNNNNNTTSAFGSAQPSGFGAAPAATTGGFGSTNAFGAKPGGLFGSTTQAAPAAGSSLFGQANQTPSAFGNTNNTTNAFGGQTQQAGGLFGNNAAKPSGFGAFGNTTNNAAPANNAFGAPAAGTTNVFGSTTNNAGGGLFGGTAQNNTTTNTFGGATTQQPAATGFGGSAFGAQTQNAGGGLFGNAQQKPGGLFGGATATPAAGGGGLFGGTAASATPFGGSAAQPANAGGGLFGQKPAAAGGSVFGQPSTNQAGAAAGGGLFGGLGANNQQQQPAQGGGMFGGLGQTQAKPSLFGGSTQPATGGGLFGQSTQQGGLFGGSQPQQQQGSGLGLGGSLFNNSQNQQGSVNSLSTSIMDPSAYGSQTLFSMTDNKSQDPGPLATSLSGAAKAKSRSILPMYKLSPANASRFLTPQKRGFGFSYSNLGTPSSPNSTASTPGGPNQSLLMGSISRGLSKSISTSSLRRSLNVEDSILQPGAFSASSGPRLLGAGGSQRKLVINREMRSDLFSSPKETSQDGGPRKLTKRVSFDTQPARNGTADSPPQTPEASTTASEDLGFLRPVADASNGVNGSKAIPSASEPEPAKGNELAVVHEEDQAPAAVVPSIEANGDTTPGSYWMFPTQDTIASLNRIQRQNVADFTVGRENVGSVKFQVPVDLTNIDVNDVFTTIVILEPRSATVYPIAAKKPPVGKGLNVPAIISLEQSWPRARDKKTTLKDKSGPRLQKHIERLKSIKDTSFVDYNVEKGIWVFSVEHFTTYGLEEDDEDESDAELAKPPQAAPQRTGQYTAGSPLIDSPEIDPDDTFEFKRSRRPVPGAFDHAALSDDEVVDFAGEQPDVAAAGAEEPEVDTENESMEEPEEEDMMEVEEAFRNAVIEQPLQDEEDEEEQQLMASHMMEGDQQLPAGILRARMRAVKKSLAPTKIEVAGGDDWTQILQQSVRAPRTMDRAALRALNETGAAFESKERGSPVPQERPAVDGTGFATSIDLMKSLFDQSRGPSQSLEKPPAKGFVKWPYQRREKIDVHEEEMPARRLEWGPDETLLAAKNDGVALLSADVDTSAVTADKLRRLEQYIKNTTVNIEGSLPEGPGLRQLAEDDTLWDLATVLFEEDGARLAEFWERLVAEPTADLVASMASAEEKAIACLSGNLKGQACEHLLAGGNFRLATLVSSIGTQSQHMRAQLNDWKESNALSEFSEPIRALYELLAGNSCTCAGVKGVAIESRVSSFVISQRFNLDWSQSFALRLFYSSGPSRVSDAIRSFQEDIEQDREPEPDSPLWFLLKISASGRFEWDNNKLEWLLTKAICASKKVDLGSDASLRLDQASLAFASSLTSQKQWVPAAFVLLHLSDSTARESAIREHLGRHAHLLGSPKSENSPFASMLKFGVPATWLWEARALHFRFQQASQDEFLALMWAKNYTEANRTFLDRLAPELVIRRDYKKLFSFAELLFKVKDQLPDWHTGALAYLVYPMVRTYDKHQPLDQWDARLFDGLVARREATHGDIRQEAAIADMAEDLLRCRGSDQRLLQLLPEDVRLRHVRNRALAV